MGMSRATVAALLLAAAPGLSGCVGLAEFRKLQYEVRQMKAGTGPTGRIADVSAEIEALREDIARLEGRVDRDHPLAAALRLAHFEQAPLEVDVVPVEPE